MKANFYQSLTCASGTHCGICRRKGEEGIAFRTKMLATFDGIDNAGFPCPAEKPWTDPPPPKPRKTVLVDANSPRIPQKTQAQVDEEGRRRAICRQCEFIAPDGTCGLLAGCCGGRSPSPLMYRCPRDKWKKEAA